MATPKKLKDRVLAILKDPAVDPAIKRPLSHAYSIIDISSGVDHILDRHIDDVEKGDNLENMLHEAVREFLKPSEY